MKHLLIVMREIRAARRAGELTLGEVAFVLWFELGIWLFVKDRKP